MIIQIAVVCDGLPPSKYKASRGANDVPTTPHPKPTNVNTLSLKKIEMQVTSLVMATVANLVTTYESAYCGKRSLVMVAEQHNICESAVDMVEENMPASTKPIMIGESRSCEIIGSAVSASKLAVSGIKTRAMSPAETVST